MRLVANIVSIAASCRSRQSLRAWRLRDLAESDKLNFTQQFLAEMLRTSRPSVSIAAHRLPSIGLIKYSRGFVEILNADGLLETSCECYEVVKEYYRNLLGANA